VGVHASLAVNHTSTPLTDEEGWWVIDDWIGEKTLADHLAKPWPMKEVPRLLLEIARGLEALHDAGVIFRELAPNRVLLADKDGRAVLTDFELAKLLDGSPSVSSDWPEDPFRAPEVEEGDVTVRADLFSLAQIAAAAIAGSEFDIGRAPEILGSVEMPKSLKRLLIDASQDDADRRPNKLAPILKGLTNWTEKTSRGNTS
jgi:serine/threonine protein kinase